MIGARVFGGVLLAAGVIAFVATLGVGDDWSRERAAARSRGLLACC